ncbi:hybrid sensor histidine kinase/response regulator [Nodularia sphaerocarpa]|uniref:hybrid sensor histidine kinase/response regulator n=1 Tax=Nodularia sphaerocarpa TaxID=137816 RepID=UPI001EFA6E79|nr:ATP-binding protein [Nodularia sphaerocarpa]MDB9372817.1 response regulator [Nodularia sphaerocarpa CS-585]MDB9379384.1 response regulator [Nodularia sphaerocarpa CS-585A2]ULP71591.1 Cell-division control histidine kinase PdhS [Nodularia sphaerocarpa UHCC 0038]
MISIPPHTQTTKTVKILVVEDEFILAVNLQETLESLKYTVVGLADSAAEAISQAKELRPNLILMDIRLRGEQDGIQAAELIWNTLQIPVIYVTGHSDKYTVERVTLTSPFGYILKPIKEQELYVAIQTALNRYEREQFLTSVLRGMGDGVIVVDPQLHIKYMNQVSEALTGWRWDEVKGQLLTEVVKLIDEQTQLPAENSIIFALEQETTIYLDSLVLLIAKDGTTIPIAHTATPLRDNHGVITGAVLVFRDDTQRRLIAERDLADKTARELGIQLIEMERLNQLKEDFLATTSHEMRTPLSNMKMAICMLEHILDQPGVLQSVPPTTSWSINRYLNILRDQCEQELDLVDDLLYMRIIDADFYPLELTYIQMQNWLPHVTAAFQERSQNSEQILQVSVSPDLPPVLSDMSLLTKIVSELLNNAYKYTPPEQEITVNSQLVTNTDAEISLFEITVSNSGVTIPLEEQFRIFEAFYRIPQSDRWRHGGTGLGLAVVRKLVEYLQGTITVTSTNDWTRFIVQLPLKHQS